MTEAEWLAAADPAPMLEFLRGNPGDRKLRLFAAGCCRRIWDVLTKSESRAAVETAEDGADGLAGDAELEAAWRAGLAVADVYGEEAAAAAAHPDGDRVAWVAEAASYARPGGEPAAQAQLLRDIFGNPSSPITFDPSWRTPDVVALARRMYDSRDFTGMPVLADALEEAGCDAEDVLSHCRGQGHHVRGCWVADSCLGLA